VSTNSGPDAVPPDADEDSIVMEALAAGSAEAMGVVYDRLAPGIHAQAVRLVGVVTADDVVQETFERVWRNAARFDARRGTLEAWAFRIARNVALGLLRRPATPTLTDRLEQADMTGGPAETAERHDVQAAVQSAIAALSGERRAVVEHVLDGFTLVQTAARLGVPEGTAKSRARAAYAELRSALAAHGSA
jgi:RNA polymerase sigma-70 factor (ECF subfamily)